VRGTSWIYCRHIPRNNNNNWRVLCCAWHASWSCMTSSTFWAFFCPPWLAGLLQAEGCSLVRAAGMALGGKSFATFTPEHVLVSWCQTVLLWCSV